MILDEFSFPSECWLKSGDPRLREASASKGFAGQTSIGILSLKFPGDLYSYSKQGRRDKELADRQWQEHCRA